MLITKRGIRLRGMNRNKVIVDGTRPGSRVCSRRASDQNLGPPGAKGPLGLNGIMVFAANSVSVQNLTACNFLSGNGEAGNEIWWNGNDGTGKIGGWGYNGSYLTATSTYFKEREDGRTVRHLLEQLERRSVGEHVHEQLQRLRLLHRGMPAGVQPDDRPRLGSVQLARLLRLELGRRARDQELRVGQQPGRV